MLSLARTGVNINKGIGVFFWASLKLTPNSWGSQPFVNTEGLFVLFYCEFVWVEKETHELERGKGHSVQHPWEGSWATYWLVWSSK